MKVISILCGKLLLFIGKLVGKGSTLPGEYALKIDKNLLNKLEIPKRVIAVTGSSGKGSTTAIIRRIFEEQGYSVCHNDSGANLVSGITSTFIDNCTLSGKIKKDVVILEVDERYVSSLFKYIKPEILVVTNICRDQPPRQGNVDIVFEKINESISDGITLVLNGDDPYLRKFEINNPKNKVVYYGVDKNKYSYKRELFRNLNINYCPLCNNKLSYNYRNFESNGDYFCDHCDFKRENISCKVTKIDYDNNLICIDGKYMVNAQYNILFSIYNTLASFLVSDLCGLDKEKTVNTLNNIFKNKKIYSEYKYNNRKVVVLNNKNENSSTFNQSLLYINRYKEDKIVMIGWKEISRRYEFNDMSWMYDVDFEILNNEKTLKVICAGRDKYNIAQRLYLAGFDKKRIFLFDSLTDAVGYIKEKTKGDIYAILNFDYVKPFNDMMDGDSNEN